MSEMNSSVLKREYLALKDSIEGEWDYVYEKSKSIFSESFFDVPHETVHNLPRIDSVHTMPGPMENEGRGSRPGATLSQPFHRPEVMLSAHHSLGAVAERNPSAPTTTTHNKPVEPIARPFSNRGVAASIVPSKSSVSETIKKMAIPETPSERNVVMGQPMSRQSLPTPLPLTTPVAQSHEAFFNTRNDANHDDRRKIILALIKQKPALTVKDIARSIPHVSEKTIQRELLSMVSVGILFKRGERRWSTYSLRQ
jgi:hypothetical protein